VNRRRGRGRLGPGRLDGLRLAVGTLTALPVRPPRAVDARTVRAALVWTPVVGAALGAAGAAVLVALASTPLLAATLAVATLALLTRGLHLDGLADTADGLGSGRSADQALVIMRRSDVGPFGVATLVLTLLVQVSALAAASSAGPALVVAVVTGRLAVVWGCVRGVPAARASGLGAAFAGAAPAWLALGWTGVVTLGSGFALAPSVVLGPVAVLAGLAAGGLVVRQAVRRLGGVTGDVFGAAVELGTAASLVVVAAWPAG
jgi:adenosylcobinamide-GDP ribazoletransferase